jgi:hypothetical protein
MKKDWIYFRLGFNINGDIPRKKINELFSKTKECFKNKMFFYNKLTDSLMTDPLSKEKETGELYMLSGTSSWLIKKSFDTTIEREDDTWHVFFTPSKGEGLYDPEDLDKDLPVFCRLDEKIQKELKIEGNPPTFNIGFEDGQPTLEQKEGFLTYKYRVEDRLRYENEYKTPIVFLAGKFKNFYKVIKKNNPGKALKIQDAIDRTNWMEAVEDILKKN